MRKRDNHMMTDFPRFRRISGIVALLLIASAFTAYPQGTSDAPAPLVLTGATLIDGTGVPPRTGSTIVIEDGLIADIYDTGTQDVPEGATVLDLAEQYVLPGLIDAHVHFTALRENQTDVLRALLNRGITTVRDLAGDARTLAVLARDARTGTIASPDIYYAAVFFGPPFASNPRMRFASRSLKPGTAPWARAVTADTDLAQVIAEAKGTGASGLKLYDSLEPDVMRRIVDEAHRQGLRVWAHATVYPSSPSEVIAAGVDGVEHAHYLYPEGSSDIPETYEEGRHEWFSAQDLSTSDPRAEPFTKLYADMAARGVYLTPTPHVAHRFARSKEDEVPVQSPQWWAATKTWECKATEAAHRAGVPIVAGTDANGTVPIQVEMELLANCGLTPLDVITAATLHAAEIIGIARTHGSVEPGKAANLVVLASDPTEDIGNSRDVLLVVKAGKVYEVGE